jgi:hypothetical protein
MKCQITLSGFIPCCCFRCDFPIKRCSGCCRSHLFWRCLCFICIYLRILVSNTISISQGRPPLKLEKIWFFGVKSWFFTRNTPNIFAPPSARCNFFKCAPPNLKSWIHPCIRCQMMFVSINSSTTGVTCGTGTDNTQEHLSSLPAFRSVCVARSSVFV